MSPLRRIALVVLVVFTAVAAGCSGGNADNAEPAGGEWDTMKWDQDNWS
jgi:hypothetical protein